MPCLEGTNKKPYSKSGVAIKKTPVEISFLFSSMSRIQNKAKTTVSTHGIWVCKCAVYSWIDNSSICIPQLSKMDGLCMAEDPRKCSVECNFWDLRDIFISNALCTHCVGYWEGTPIYCYKAQQHIGYSSLSVPLATVHSRTDEERETRDVPLSQTQNISSISDVTL